MRVGGYIMPYKSALQIFLEQIAQTAVTETRKTFSLGSCNIKHNAFYPPYGMLQYQPKQKKRYHDNIRLAEALTLVRDEDVRDLPEVYKYDQKLLWFDALVDKSRADITAILVPALVERYEAADKIAEIKARIFKGDLRCLASKERLKMAREVNAGNCCEMAECAFHYINSNFSGYKDSNRPVVVSLYRTGVIGRQKFGPSGAVHDTEIDHSCVVIGRNSGDDDWRTWNREAIVVDPWIGRWFYATRLRQENPWPFNVPTQDIRFENYLWQEDKTPVRVKPAVTKNSRSVSF